MSVTLENLITGILKSLWISIFEWVTLVTLMTTSLRGYFAITVGNVNIIDVRNQGVNNFVTEKRASEWRLELKTLAIPYLLNTNTKKLLSAILKKWMYKAI